MVDIGKWKAEGMDAVQLTTTSVQGSGTTAQAVPWFTMFFGYITVHSTKSCLWTGRNGYIRLQKQRATNSHIVPGSDFLHGLLMGECEQFCFDFGMYMGFPKIVVPPKSSIINHPFWGTPILETPTLRP